jgi:flagellar basal body-associated protein FliL
MPINSKKYLLLLIFITGLSLFLSGCGKKEEAQKPVPPPPPAPQVVAAQPVAVSQTDPGDDRRMAAIFTANHADKVLDDKLPSLEDYISSRITDKGFSAISREVATAAASSLLKDSPQTEIDKALNNNASVLRLSQMLGANYIILATISSYGTEKQTVEAYDIKKVSVVTTLRVSYKILDGIQGGTLGGDTFKVSSTKVFTENSRIESTDIINDLLDEAAVKIAESAGSKTIRTIVASSKLAEFSVACGM